MGTGVSASVGFAGTVNEAQWSSLGYPVNRGYVEGCAPTAGGGTREVTIASGSVWVAGTQHTVSGATLAMAENTSGQSRIDVVALEVDWTADDAALVVVQGTPAASPSAPLGSLDSDYGSSWHVPLAHVLVANGAGVLPSSAITDVRPGPWIAVTMQSGWSNYGSDYFDAKRRMTPAGDVELRGVVQRSLGLGVDNPICDIPEGWRSLERMVWAQIGTPNWEPDDRVGGEGLVRVDMRPEFGYMSVVRPNRTDAQVRWVSLDGIRWSTA